MEGVSFAMPTPATTNRRMRISPSCCERPANGAAQPQARKRLRARTAYDGTKYIGWQYQKYGNTVQKELEKAFSRRIGQKVRVVGASRTDAGVHARGQAFHVDLPATSAPADVDELQQMQFVVNQMLPDDISMTRLGEAPTYAGKDGKPHAWSAIYDATGKLYSYRFTVATIPDPLQRLYMHAEWRAARYGFCDERLRAAADKFVGTHDFSAFANSSSMPDGMRAAVDVNPFRRIRSIAIVRETADIYRLDFRIDGALYKMIRNIMGTLLDVACYKLDVDYIDELFESRDRRRVAKSAPACGLCLEQVFYDDWHM